MSGDSASEGRVTVFFTPGAEFHGSFGAWRHRFYELLLVARFAWAHGDDSGVRAALDLLGDMVAGIPERAQPEWRAEIEAYVADWLTDERYGEARRVLEARVEQAKGSDR